MDHSTRELERVLSRLPRRFADRLDEWVHEVSGSQDIGLEGLEEKVQDGMHNLGGEILQGTGRLGRNGQDSQASLVPEV